MQCSLCNKVALRIVGKKGFCGTPMDVDGHYREAVAAITFEKIKIESKIAANNPGHREHNRSVRANDMDGLHYNPLYVRTGLYH